MDGRRRLAVLVGAAVLLAVATLLLVERLGLTPTSTPKAGDVTAVTLGRTVHVELRGLDDSGQYPEAVRLAIGADPSSATAFNAVDDRLAQAIAAADRAFTDRADSAGGALAGAAFGWTVLTLLLVAGVVVGLQQRIAEYR